MRLEDGADEDGANLLMAHVVHVKRLPAAIFTLPSDERGEMHLSTRVLKKKLGKEVELWSHYA